jgi:hypothetical protein
MAGAGTDRISTTTDKSAVWDGSRNPRGDVRRHDHEDTLSVVRRKERKDESEESVLPLTLIVVIEQWICLVLGIACLASGIVGIAMNPGQNDLSAGFPWSKSIYVPLLRITAAVSLALGVVLLRLGWASPVRTQRRVCIHIIKEAPHEARR